MDGSSISENNVYKQVYAMMDKNTLFRYRSANNLTSLSLYLMQPNILGKLDNKDICKQTYQKIKNNRSRYTNYTIESYTNIEKHIENTRLAIGLKVLKQLNEADVREYMLINPILKVGTDIIILDTSALYSVYCSDYIERFINTRNKQKLHAEYGYAQEKLIEWLVNGIFKNSGIHIEKVEETGKNKLHDFNVYVKNNIVIHAESKFAIGKVTTHYKKENTDDKAIKQLREHNEFSIQNIIINTTSTYLFEYKTHDNIKVRSLSIIGFIGYLCLILIKEMAYKDDAFRDTMVLEDIGEELILKLLKN